MTGSKGSSETENSQGTTSGARTPADPPPAATTAEVVAEVIKALAGMGIVPTPAPPQQPQTAAAEVAASNVADPHLDSYVEVTRRLRLPHADRPAHFDGEELNKLQDWIFACEAWVEGSDPTDEDRIRLMASLLRRTAADWYRYWRSELIRLQTPNPSYDDFIVAISEHFQDLTEIAAVRKRYHNAKQHGFTLPQYAMYMRNFMIHPALKGFANELQIADRFIEGLRPDIKQQVRLDLKGQDPESLKRAIELAHVAEAALPPPPRQNQNPGYRPAGQKGRHVAAMQNRSDGDGQRKFNRPRDTTLVAGRDGKTFENIKCFGCQSWGHYENRCPRVSGEKPDHRPRQGGSGQGNSQA